KRGLTRSWARELAPWQITVNLVAPGWIPTERHAHDPQEAKDAYAALVPLQRMGVPEDVAEAVAFLASDGANFITGQKLSVNGGKTLAERYGCFCSCPPPPAVPPQINPPDGTAPRGAFPSCLAPPRSKTRPHTPPSPHDPV